MTAEEWAQVFRAGAHAIPSKSMEAANALSIALHAMAVECSRIALLAGDGGEDS